MGNSAIFFYFFNGIYPIKINSIVNIYEMIFIYHDLNFSAQIFPTDSSVV